MQSVGCFAVVFEAVPAAIAEEIAARLEIPAIGIGAGPATAGQVLVYHDLLGITTGRSPKFVKRYAEIHAAMVEGVARYADEVRARRFPAAEHVYSIEPAELAEFRHYLEQKDGIGSTPELGLGAAALARTTIGADEPHGGAAARASWSSSTRRCRRARGAPCTRRGPRRCSAPATPTPR